jgi:hypothetical protein
MNLFGQSFTLHYDAAGRLVRKDSMGVVQSYFLWDRDHLLAELRGADGTPIPQYSYYPGMDNPHAAIIDGVLYNYHRDAEGNVVALTDPSQNVVQTYSCDVWGSCGGPVYTPVHGKTRPLYKGALDFGPYLALY